MNSELKIMTIVIIVGICAFLGVLTFNTMREIPLSLEEQVSIQEEEMEVMGLYECDFPLIYKIHDNKDNVTCWIYRGGQRGGISCIPDYMLSP